MASSPAQPAPELSSQSPETTAVKILKPDKKPGWGTPSKLRGKSRSRAVYASQHYVEHLRSVHFTLLSVSAGLLLLVLSVKPYDTRIAIMQLRGIQKFKSDWSPKWIHDHRNVKGPNGILFFDMAIQHHKQSTASLMIHGSPLLETINTIIIKVVEKAGNKPILVKIALPPDKDFVWAQGDLNGIPNRLDNFARWWNSFARPTHTFIQIGQIGNKCISQTLKICEIVRGTISTDKTTKQLKTLPTLNAYVLYDNKAENGNKVKLQVALPNRDHLEFEVITYFISEVSQRDVLDLFPGSTAGDFSTSFRDLNGATVGIQSLDFDDVSRYLDASGTSSEVFEAFGMKIPSGQVTTWGTVAILCIQLYLFMYLRRLKRPLEPSDTAWDVGWFATDAAFLPRSVFFVTIWILPLVTVVFLARYAIDKRLQEAALGWHWGVVFSKGALVFARDFRSVPFITVGCLISLVLGYLNWSNRPRVELEPAPSRRQMFE